MQQYLNGVKQIFDRAGDEIREDRTGSGTLSTFGMQIDYDLSQGKFPLLTTKKMKFENIVNELIWFLSGSTNNEELKAMGTNIWNEWALEDQKVIQSSHEISVQEQLLVLNQSATCQTFKTGDSMNIRRKSDGREFTVEEHVRILNIDDYEERIKEYASYGFEYDRIRKVEFKSSMTKGELGPIYSKMWRNWDDYRFVDGDDYELNKAYYDANFSFVTDYDENAIQDGKTGKYLLHRKVDQISELMKGLKERPTSRRHILSGWNPALVPEEGASHEENVLRGQQALPPCHTLCQFYARKLSTKEREAIAKQKGIELDQAPEYELSSQLYQRSADYMVGVPYNVASYALLTMMIAHCLNMTVGKFIHTMGDAHIYKKHIEGAELQLSRTPTELPTVKINPDVKSIFDFKPEDFTLLDYHPQKFIKYDIAV